MEHKLNHPHAFLDENNIVVSVCAFDGHDESFINEIKIHLGASDVKCCCNYGDAYTGGDFYNEKFYMPKPFQSWIRNEELVIWEAPIPYPVFDEENPRYYEWNEEILNWEEIQVSE